MVPSSSAVGSDTRRQQSTERPDYFPDFDFPNHPARHASNNNSDVRTIRCTECDRKPCAHENLDDKWRVYSDGVGELHIFCPEAEREFGGGAPYPPSSRASTPAPMSPDV